MRGGLKEGLDLRLRERINWDAGVLAVAGDAPCWTHEGGEVWDPISRDRETARVGDLDASVSRGQKQRAMMA
jgi:hypothetical protein